MDIQILLAQVEATDAFGELAPPMQIAILLGALSFATAALVSLTAFTRIIIVLSFVRRALSTTEIPPNQVMLGLSFFLTLLLFGFGIALLATDSPVSLYSVIALCGLAFFSLLNAACASSGLSV